MKKTLKRFIVLFTLLILSFDNVACAPKTEVKVEAKTTEYENDAEKEALVDTVSEDMYPMITIHQEEILQSKYASIVSFGDTLCHTQVYNDAYDSDSGIYDFSHIFKNVEKYFEKCNINIGNCESPMAGGDRGYSGYPCFNAPEHLATDLKEMNIDIMTTANNHCLDKGYSGLESTLNYLDEAEIDHVGTSRSQEEQDTILIKDLNGIKTAFLSFTYGTNGIPIPSGKEYCVNMMDEDFMLKQINAAKEQEADLIVVSIHWGIEYQTTENAQQDKLAEFLIKNGVKVILGCHPHVLQPMKKLTVECEDGEEKEGIVIFSQGNFFSSQTKPNTRNTAIFKINVKKDAFTDKTEVESVTYIPLYLYDNGFQAKDRYELLDLNEIIRSYEAGEDTWNDNMYNLALTEKKRCVDTIGPEILVE